MILSPRWRKVARDLWVEKSRTGIVVASIAIGIIAFGGLFGTRTIVAENIALEYSRFNENDVAYRITGLDDATVAWAARQPFVTDAQGLTVYNAEALLPVGVEDVVITAFEDYSDIRINRLLPEAGKVPPERGEVVIERSYADAVGLAIGDEMTLEIEAERTVNLGYVGTVHDLNAFPNTVDPRIKLYVTPRTLRLLDFDPTFNQLYITLDRAAIANADTTLDAVANSLREDMERLGVPVDGVSVNRDGKLWAGDFANGIAAILFLVGSAAVVLCGFLVLNVITGLLAQQRRQIGMMKIIGATGWQVASLYLTLVAAFGVLALVLALPVSRLLARGVSGALLGVGFLNVDVSVFQLPFFVVLVQVVVAVTAPVIAGLLPIIKGTRVSVLDSLRDGENAEIDGIDRLLARLKGLPRPVLLALRNTFRRKARLVSTLVTLVVAGAFFMGALNIRVSVLKEATTVALAGSDLRFNLSDYYDRGGVQMRVGGVDGITDVEGWVTGTVNRVRPDSSESDDLTLTGVPADSPYNTPVITEGRWLVPPTPNNRNEIVISTEFENLEPDVRVGDMLRLTFDGTDQDWRVVGIVETGGPTSVTPPLYTYYEGASRYLQVPEQTNFVLAATRSNTLDADTQVEAASVAELDRFGIEVGSSSVVLEESENARSSFDVIIFLLAFVAMIIAIVGGFGLGGTMSLAVMERTREIGVMRSVGASSNTLRGMYVLESVLIGAMSYVLALPFSLLVSYGFAVAIAGIFGRDRPLEFGVNPVGLGMWAAIILVVAAVASLLPAQRAASISIREALAYE
jgi:putative ABC transport system permease protein